MEWSFRYQRTLSFYSTAISVVAFSHDYTKLISGSGSGDIKIWDTTQWAELRTLRPDGSKNSVPRCVSMSRGGLLACCHPNVICVYSPTFERELTLLPPQDYGPATWRCLCFSPTRTVDHLTGESGEDNALVAWTESALCVYSVESNSTLPRITRSVVHASGPPRVCSFTRCGTRVVCGHEDGQIYVWNASSYTLEKTLIGHLGAITSFDFSIATEEHTSMLVTCSLDKAMRLWEGHERGWQLAYFLSASLVHDHQAVRACQFSKDGNIFVTCGLELVVWKWLPERRNNPDSGAPLVPHQKLKGCMDGMRLRVIAAGETQIVVGTIDGVLGVWSMCSGAPPPNEQIKAEHKDRIEQEMLSASAGELSENAMTKGSLVKKIDKSKTMDGFRLPPKMQPRCAMYKVTESPMYGSPSFQMQQHRMYECTMTSAVRKKRCQDLSLQSPTRGSSRHNNNSLLSPTRGNGNSRNHNSGLSPNGKLNGGSPTLGLSPTGRKMMLTLECTDIPMRRKSDSVLLNENSPLYQSPSAPMLPTIYNGPRGTDRVLPSGNGQLRRAISSSSTMRRVTLEPVMI